MDGKTVLEMHWRLALAVASAAVDAAADAHTLTREECARERARIRAEREWLDRARWPRV
jgi:hypothetical protein